MNPQMMKLLPRVMALFSKLKNLTEEGAEGKEQTAAAVVKVGEFGGARGLVLSGTVEGEPFYILAVGGEKSAAMLAGLAPE